jgi:hypothetical protein
MTGLNFDQFGPKLASIAAQITTGQKGASLWHVDQVRHHTRDLIEPFSSFLAPGNGPD